MVSKNKAKAKRTQIPPEAARVLSIAQAKAQQLQAELNFLGILVRGYTASIRLDPGRKYTFTQQGKKVYAEEVEVE